MAAKALSRVLSRLRGSMARDGGPGEDAACVLLEQAGLEVVERNFRCRSGEIDVVAREGDVTVFVEVRLRSDGRHGQACDSVTFGKRRRIVRAARLFAMSRGLGDVPFRFDVVAIDGEPDGGYRMRHERGAFDAEGR